MCDLNVGEGFKNIQLTGYSLLQQFTSPCTVNIFVFLSLCPSLSVLKGELI